MVFWSCVVGVHFFHLSQGQKSYRTHTQASVGGRNSIWIRYGVTFMGWIEIYVHLFLIGSGETTNFRQV